MIRQPVMWKAAMGRWRQASCAIVGSGVLTAVSSSAHSAAAYSTTYGARNAGEATIADISLKPAASKGPRSPLLRHEFDYDVIVVGGGSGGLSCAREVAALGGKVALFDYVKPSTHGTKWGLGGTCVNVGCIPKKLMHHASLLGQQLYDAVEYGWKLPAVKGIQHDWHAMTANVHAYIKGTNWGYKSALKDERVEYVNAEARLRDAHTVEASDRKGTRTLTAAHIIVAVGGRPKYPEGVEGAELGITSDDLFWLSKPPGKTLLVGAGYVALECAGFLTHLGMEASVMARGQVLRGFDQQVAEKIVTHMHLTGTRFLRGATPKRLEKVKTTDAAGEEKEMIRVTWSEYIGAAAEHAHAHVVEKSEDFDTVLFATGRYPVTSGLGLEEVGVKMDRSGKVLGYRGSEVTQSSTTGSSLQTAHTVLSDFAETTSVPSIHAIGDVLSGRPELTPVAIRAGKLLAKRIMRDEMRMDLPVSSAGPDAMDYALVPTTIFTPLEYGCVGLSEEEAGRQYGKDNIDVYHLQYDTLELGVSHRSDHEGMPLPPQCYTKLIVNRGDETVLGLHVLGPNAAEVIQGFAVAIRLGAKKSDLDATIGIHPSHAEEVVTLDKTKRSGASYTKTSC